MTAFVLTVSQAGDVAGAGCFASHPTDASPCSNWASLDSAAALHKPQTGQRRLCSPNWANCAPGACVRDLRSHQAPASVGRDPDPISIQLLPLRFVQTHQCASVRAAGRGERWTDRWAASKGQPALSPLKVSLPASLAVVPKHGQQPPSLRTFCATPTTRATPWCPLIPVLCQMLLCPPPWEAGTWAVSAEAFESCAELSINCPCQVPLQDPRGQALCEHLSGRMMAEAGRRVGAHAY